ncbi:glycosyltransferase [Glaciimonas sp. CA11.2]|uniref:glycosyltransferase n=1 Tax=unclassified Glaciimonas TaxID=2644401 RepID=UPI002AB4A8C6|nr:MULTISPECIES: glycosyltransferase [unclassified Glaciimonas]MDY7544676.1 glycosyltransferase [Glaciimonas sp. CA11.2]MEB0012026.1 glycosyltransferase [Glaciimonas sp. Cout2]MEB0084058.1 glycosyltransferase [Glaciimonas sp. Gout2]MEB0164452.1 glycosyltransferase [Glaciimonas sp. CA11.2]
MQPLIPSFQLPSVSVIIPVRNGKDYIQEAIDSVTCQVWGDVEILVIDDGSDDFAYETLCDQDPRIRVIRLDGQGVSSARNAGMKLAKGKYFAFLDADDIWFPGKLAAQINHFERHPEVGVVFGEFIRWQCDQSGVFTPAETLSSNCSTLRGIDPVRSGWLYTRLLGGLLVGMNTAVIRQDIYRQIGGFNETMRIGEDYEFWLRASQVAEMHSLAGPVALYRIHSASAMGRLVPDNHLASLLETARARWGLSNPDGSQLSKREFNLRVAMTHFSHGYSHYWRGDPDIARTSFLKAFTGGAHRTKSLVYCALAGFKSIKSGNADKQRPAPLQQSSLSGIEASPIKSISTKSAAKAKAQTEKPDNRNGEMPIAMGTPLWARMVSTIICGGLTGSPDHALTIFTFHKVPGESDTGYQGEFSLRDFQSLIAILLENFNILPLAEGIERLQRKDLPRFAAAITFDDGYPNWLSGVVPVLEKSAIPATFFISTCQLEGRALWFERLYSILRLTETDRTPLIAPLMAHGLYLDHKMIQDADNILKAIKYLPTIQRDNVISSCEAALNLKPNYPLFTTHDLKALQSKGFAIGAHTVNHPILACCTDADARIEIVRSKEMLEDVLREPVNLFSYPNGVPGRDIKPSHVRLVQAARFKGAVTTALGAASNHTPIFQLPRFDPWARTPRRLLIQYLMTLNRPFPIIEETQDALMVE